MARSSLVCRKIFEEKFCVPAARVQRPIGFTSFSAALQWPLRSFSKGIWHLSRTAGCIPFRSCGCHDRNGSATCRALQPCEGLPGFELLIGIAAGIMFFHWTLQRSDQVWQIFVHTVCNTVPQNDLKHSNPGPLARPSNPQSILSDI